MSKKKKSNNPLIEGFIDRVMSKIKERLTRYKMAKNSKLQNAAKDIDYAKNKFSKQYEKEFGEKPEKAVMDYINSF